MDFNLQKLSGLWCKGARATAGFLLQLTSGFILLQFMKCSLLILCTCNGQWILITIYMCVMVQRERGKKRKTWQCVGLSTKSEMAASERGKVQSTTDPQDGQRSD